MSRFKTTSSHSNGFEIFSVLREGTVAKHTLRLRLHEKYYLSTVLKLLQNKREVKTYIKAKRKVVTERHATESYWGSGGIAPHILDLGTS
jgi:hypothetical protein